MADKCLFCDSSNLNTTMTVKIDGQPHTIALCEMHEDQTPRSIKEQLAKENRNQQADLKRQQKMKQLKDLAKELGVDIPVVSKPASITKPATINTKPTKLVPQKKRTPPPPPPPEAEPIAESQPSQPPAGVESHSEYQPKGITNCKIQTTARENQIVETSTRGPIPLPKKVFDNEGGRTEIRIIKTGGNRELQKRFESMAESSKRNEGSHHFGKGGYNVSDCPMCGGSGKARTDPKQACPKCKGGGVFDRQ